MRWKDFIDYKELKKTISVLKPNHQLFEVRILGTDKRRVFSGYFTDYETLCSALDSIDLRGQNIYITLNKVNEALYSRSQHDQFIANTNTTSDTEIDSYNWLFIDFDPVRPTNISSSDAELQRAAESKNTVKEYLRQIGFCEPIEALSGNGYHLLYKIDLLNTTENIQLISDCLNVLSEMFNTKEVKVDTTNCNPSRICKLHGTLAQKGASTNSRPHRMSKLLIVPELITNTPREKLVELSNLLPKSNAPVKIQRASYLNQTFDIRDWLSKYNISYKEDVGRDCQIYMLDECPFDSNHKNGDSKIFAYTDGAIAFKCHHNSCKGYKWQDVRLKFEPGAYDHKEDDARIEAGYKAHKQHKEDNVFIPLEDDETPKQPKKTSKIKRKLKTAEGLMGKDLPEPKVLIGVGEEIPMLVEGTCILSARPKLGKSWLALSMCLALAKGEDFLGYKTNKCSTLYLDLETSEQLQQKRIRKALAGSKVPSNFYIDTETDDLDHGFVAQIENYLEQDEKIGLVVIDVFQIIRSRSSSIKETEYEHAYRDITPLNELAQKHHISIILVCHDRKAVDPEDPFSNILGSTGLQGAATQMMVMFQRGKNPIHISIKGKTIDGLPELDVKLDNGLWSKVDGGNSKEREKSEADEEYLNSKIRSAVLAIAKETETKGEWKGKCSDIIGEAVNVGVGLEETPKGIGGFLHKHAGRFLSRDNVKVNFISNGTGSTFYRICKSTIDTIDGNDTSTIDEFQQMSISDTLRLPFT